MFGKKYVIQNCYVNQFSNLSLQAVCNGFLQTMWGHDLSEVGQICRETQISFQQQQYK